MRAVNLDYIEPRLDSSTCVQQCRYPTGSHFVWESTRDRSMKPGTLCPEGETGMPPATA